jgi:peptidoglycan/LPS O-acetylase OafA/YrhL
LGHSTTVDTPVYRVHGSGEAGALGDLGPVSGFRPDVQALRGLAVLLVVLYHAGDLVPGGFVGVDVFFVISGFVIGRMLTAGFALGGVSFRSFYERRVRRLLPALAVTLTSVVLLAPLLAPVGAVDSTAATGAAAALFGANAYLYLTTAGGYFAADVEWNALLHTWSLSVEEQFYFVIPVLLLLAWRAGRRWGRPIDALRCFVAVMVLASFVACIAAGSGGGPDGLRFAFFSPLTRAWEFGVGTALVLIPGSWSPRSRAGRGVLSVGGVVLIAMAAATFSDGTDFPGLSTLVPVLGAALVIWGGSLRSGSREDRLPAPPVRAAVRLGDRSYAWYLWHWPLIVFAGAFWPTAGRLPLVLAALVSLAPAEASHRYLEQRIRATPRGRRWPGPRIVACCIAVPVVAAVLAVPMSAALERRTPAAGATQTSDRLAACNDPTPLGERDPESCVFGDPAAGASWVLIGDSNADQLGEALIGAAEAEGARVRVATRAGCPILDAVVDAGWSVDDGERCRRFVEGTIDHLAADPPDLVVVANATDVYLHREDVVLTDPRTGDRATDAAAKASAYQSALERSLLRLRDAGTRVALVEVVPKPSAAGVDFDVRECSRLLLMVDPGRCRTPSFLVADGSTIPANQLEKRSAAAAGVETWGFVDELCPRGRCVTGPGDPPIWIEPSHITDVAAGALAPAVRQRVTAFPPG